MPLKLAGTVEACIMLRKANVDMTLAEIREFVAACMELGARRYIETGRRLEQDISGTVIDGE